MPEIQIDLSRCTGCGQCVDFCPFEVLELVSASGHRKPDDRPRRPGRRGAPCATPAWASALPEPFVSSRPRPRPRRSARKWGQGPRPSLTMSVSATKSGTRRSSVSSPFAGTRWPYRSSGPMPPCRTRLCPRRNCATANRSWQRAGAIRC